MRSAAIRLTLLALIGLSVAACMPRLVPPGAEFLGKREVSFAVEHDALIFPAGTKPIRKLVLVVRLNDVDIRGLRIAFENGDDYEIDYRGIFIANRDSQVFDLPGAARRIRRIDFLYKRTGRTMYRAEIEFWGL